MFLSAFLDSATTMATSLASWKRLQAELSGLYAQSHRLQSRIALLLICDIFALTLFGSDCIMPEPPWALGLVCGSWRQLALAYPRLWSSVTIPAYERRDSRHMMETQLVRSANTRLHIYWELIQSDLPVPSLDLVIAESNRWKTLRLDLALSRTGDRGRLSLQAFCRAPFLNYLNEVILIDRDFRGFCSPLYLDSLVPITHFRGMYAPESQLDILAAAQNLVRMRPRVYHFHRYRNGTSSDYPPPAPPALIDQPDHLVKLTAPMLEGLSIPEVRFPTLLSFVHRSCCTLVKLVLINCRVIPQIIPVFRGIPTLASLLVESPLPRGPSNICLGSAVDILPQLNIIRLWLSTRGFRNHLSSPCAPLAYLRLYDITQDPDTLNMDAQIREFM
ncbi:hypothetical protein B0H14DRAFT_2702349 [Mycena olivaceomarginata]|nr:hypothetical protein B0H14DRAFT_2702349 [Mycena olivaceomarginata]